MMLMYKSSLCRMLAVASHLDVDVDGVLGVVADHCPHVVEEENKLVVPLQGRLEKVSLVQCC